MPPFARLVVTFVTVVGIVFFAYWIGVALLPESIPDLVPFAVAAVLAFGAGRLVWTRSRESDGLVSTVCTGAMVTGAISFAAGFFGPMLLTPDANQGPLLGILITGPLGVVAGAIGGGVYWAVRRRRD